MSIRFSQWRLEVACKEATPGPWIPSGSHGTINHVVSPAQRMDIRCEETPGTYLVAESMRAADAHFIAIARHILPGLVELVATPSDVFERTVWETIREKLGTSAAQDVIQQMTLACVAAYQRGREDEAAFARKRANQGGAPVEPG